MIKKLTGRNYVAIGKNKQLGYTLPEEIKKRRWQSGQLHETVNFAPPGYAGSNPARRTTRICKNCHQEKSISDFYMTYGYSRYECKKCENRKRFLWRAKNFHKLKQRAIEYLGSKCRICGYNKSPYALEFNHLKGFKKEYEPTRLLQKGLNWERVKKELDKCELLCSNCHKEITFMKGE